VGTRARRTPEPEQHKLQRMYTAVPVAMVVHGYCSAQYITLAVDQAPRAYNAATLAN
jgi:hypothetical protein